MNGHSEKWAAAAPAQLFAGLLMLIGLVLASGGVWLIGLGGSPYYGISGVLVLGAGALLWRGSAWGERLYASMLVYTLIWALWESGLEFWALVPRLLVPALLGFVWLLPSVRRRVGGTKPGIGYPAAMSLMLVMAIVVAFIATPTMLSASHPRSVAPATASPNGGVDGELDEESDGDWRNYGNTLAGTRFSPLAQINAANVSKLEVAWVHRSGEALDLAAASQATPLKIGGVLYTCTPQSAVIALDAASGKERWRYTPEIRQPGNYFHKTCRGVSYYEGTVDVGLMANGVCSSRIFSTTVDGRLVALDARTGEPCSGFGTGGMVSLLDGFGEHNRGHQYATSPPTIVNNHVVIGGFVLDGQGLDVPSGVIRSYDPVTGELQWAWDMGRRGRTGAPSPGETYTRGTPNSWSIFSADEELGLVYVPLGNPSPDFFGGTRRPFDEKYGSAIVALDVDSGRLYWSFQTVHHDLWDYDVPAQPVLVDLPDGDSTRPALVQATKQGDLYVLDRRTGEAIVPVEERPVPQGAAPEEYTSSTQPFSALTLAPPELRESSMWGLTPIDQMICRIKFRGSRYEGIYTPPSETPTIVLPGFTGTVNWGSLSVLPGQVAIANSMAFPWRIWLINRNGATVEQLAKATYPMRGTPYVAVIEPFLGPLEVPCTQPPWGFLSAIDLATSETLWQRVLGTGRDSGPFGIPSLLPLEIGVPNLGGVLSTGGGLAFISGTLDRYLRAFDLQTGEELWKVRLPAGGQATPMTYTAAGRQYLLVTAGGHGFMDTPRGDYTIAYALPDSKYPEEKTND